MSDASGVDVIFYLLLLILPISALVARRLPIDALLKMALGWLAVFGILIILVGQRERFRPLFDGAAKAVGGIDQTVTGGTVRIPMTSDGHFWADVRINGVPVRMLVDSGATTSGLSADTARRANVAADGVAFGAAVNTANGRIVASPATVDALQLGTIQARALPVVVAPEFGQTDVLGMNFLSGLANWRVEGRTLTLTAKPR